MPTDSKEKGLSTTTQTAAPQGTPAPEGESSHKSGGPLAALLAPDTEVWKEARRLVSDKNLRVEDLATCCSQDPVVVMDLLKISNAMYFSGGKSAITSAKTAIVRLGSDVVIDILEKMKDRPALEGDEVVHWFEIHRSRCKRTAIVARILAEALARTLADDCQAAGLLMFTGELLAVAHFKETYVELAKELSRSGIIYRLAQEHKFDVEYMGLAYLRRYGIPEAVLAAIDREARTRSQERAVMKPVCLAANEMVDAFDANRWEKIAPGKTLPPKSSLRMLQIPEAQYLRIYERCSEYLFAARKQEEDRKRGPLAATSASPEDGGIDIRSTYVSNEESALQSEIQSLLRGAPEESASEAEEPPSAPAAEERDAFSIESARSQRKTEARVVRTSGASEETPGPAPATERAKRVASSLEQVFQQSSSSEEVITRMLQMLVDEGPFQKSALIVVSKDRKKAMVVAARGPNIGNGQKLVLEDPLSPLAQCFSKIQSFGNRESPNSPFGSRSYAIAPLDADHDTPVALYADCGNTTAVSFEARRIFRLVVDLLNARLPQIAGGIPIEVN